MKYVIDTYAWIEYFIGSEKGDRLKEIIRDDRNTLITATTCMAEICSWALREGFNHNQLIAAVRANSEIEDISLDEWVAAAQARHELREKLNNFGMMDAVLVVKMRKHSAKILTGDRHFKNIKNVEYLGE